MPMEKKIICFEMLEASYKLEILFFFFLVFWSRKQGNTYVQNILLTLNYIQAPKHTNFHIFHFNYK